MHYSIVAACMLLATQNLLGMQSLPAVESKRSHALDADAGDVKKNLAAQQEQERTQSKALHAYAHVWKALDATGLPATLQRLIAAYAQPCTAQFIPAYTRKIITAPVALTHHLVAISDKHFASVQIDEPHAVEIREFETGNVVDTLIKHLASIEELSMVSSTLLCTATRDHLWVWDARTRKCLCNRQMLAPNKITLSKNGNLVCTRDARIQYLDLQNNKLLEEQIFYPRATLNEPLIIHQIVPVKNDEIALHFHYGGFATPRVDYFKIVNLKHSIQTFHTALLSQEKQEYANMQVLSENLVAILVYSENGTELLVYDMRTLEEATFSHVFEGRDVYNLTYDNNKLTCVCDNLIIEIDLETKKIKCLLMSLHEYRAHRNNRKNLLHNARIIEDEDQQHLSITNILSNNSTLVHRNRHQGTPTRDVRSLDNKYIAFRDYIQSGAQPTPLYIYSQCDDAYAELMHLPEDKLALLAQLIKQFAKTPGLWLDAKAKPYKMSDEQLADLNRLPTATQRCLVSFYHLEKAAGKDDLIDSAATPACIIQ